MFFHSFYLPLHNIDMHVMLLPQGYALISRVLSMVASMAVAYGLSSQPIETMSPYLVFGGAATAAAAGVLLSSPLSLSLYVGYSVPRKWMLTIALPMADAFERQYDVYYSLCRDDTPSQSTQTFPSSSSPVSSSSSSSSYFSAAQQFKASLPFYIHFHNGSGFAVDDSNFTIPDPDDCNKKKKVTRVEIDDIGPGIEG